MSNLANDNEWERVNVGQRASHLATAAISGERLHGWSAKQSRIERKS